MPHKPTAKQPSHEYLDPTDIQPAVHALVRRWQLRPHLHGPAKLDESPPKRFQGRPAVGAESHAMLVVRSYTGNHLQIPKAGQCATAPHPGKRKGSRRLLPRQEACDGPRMEIHRRAPSTTGARQVPDPYVENVAVSCRNERLNRLHIKLSSWIVRLRSGAWQACLFDVVSLMLDAWTFARKCVAARPKMKCSILSGRRYSLERVCETPQRAHLQYSLIFVSRKKGRLLSAAQSINWM
jgi:hypothetical protein